MDEWAIQVMGGAAEIGQLDAALGAAADLREDEGRFFLVHSAWQSTGNWEDVEAAARAFLAQANGLLRIRGPAIEPLRFGGVVRLKATGGRDYFDAATVTVRVTGSAIEELIGPDGKPVPPPADPLTRWLPAVEADAELQDALRIYASATDWFELYKVYEIARKGLGGQEAVEALISSKVRSRFTQTANHHRHTDVPLPIDPMTFDEAERMISRLLEEWLN